GARLLDQQRGLLVRELEERLQRAERLVALRQVFREIRALDLDQEQRGRDAYRVASCGRRVLLVRPCAAERTIEELREGFQHRRMLRLSAPLRLRPEPGVGSSERRDFVGEDRELTVKEMRRAFDDREAGIGCMLVVPAANVVERDDLVLA